MKLGEDVFHRLLGLGKIRKLMSLGGKRKALVDFNYIEQILDENELLPTDDSNTSYSEDQHNIEEKNTRQGKDTSIPSTDKLSKTKEESVFSSPPHLHSDTVNSRKGIMALRLGQIVESQAFQLSVGTETIADELNHALSQAVQGKVTFLMVEGAWGGGKTHVLTLLKAIARKMRVATSNVVMDGISISLSEPMQLMETVLSSLRFQHQDGDQGISDLIRCFMKDGELSRLRLAGALKLSNVFSTITREAFDDTDALKVIQDYLSLSLSATQARTKLRLLGYKASGLPTLRASKIAERPKAFCTLLKDWSLLLSLMGKKGLLVILDELDVEYSSSIYGDKASHNRKEKRGAFLDALLELFPEKIPLLIAFASAPAGPEVDTENDAVEDIKARFDNRLISLQVPVPNEEDLNELFMKLQTLYRSAYPGSMEFSEDITRIISKGLLGQYKASPNAVPRHFVRLGLEVMDLISGSQASRESVLRFLQGSHK